MTILVGALFLAVSPLGAPASAKDPDSARTASPRSKARADDLGLTEQEKAFLADKDIRLGVDAVRPPFEFFDEKGLYSGITAGFVEAVSKRLGLTMTPQRNMTWTEAMQKVKTGGVDVIPKATPTAERAKFMTFTRPYVTFPTVIVTGGQRSLTGLEDLHGLKVGVVKGLVPEANLKRDHPDLPLVQMPNLREGLRALSTGALDAFVDNLGAITHAIDSLGLTNLKIAAPTPYTQDLAMGVRKDWPLLASALDKALADISNPEKAEIKSRWLAIQIQAKIDWVGILTWLGPLAAGVLMVLAVVMRANRKMGREAQERKKAEQRFAAMAANVPGAIFQVKVLEEGRRRYTYLSARGKEFFGVDPEVVIGENRTLNWHPDDKEQILKQIFASFATRTGHNLVGRIVLPDGQEKWINLTASPNPQPDGTLLYDGFILDVTERKQAEMEYLSSQSKIKAMSQAVEDALIMIDSQGKVLFWNPAAEKLFGFTAQEAMGMDFHAMAVPEKYKERTRKGLAVFARTGKGPVLGATTEIEAVDRHGRVFPVEVTLSSFQIDNEWYAVGTVRDISERKKADEALARNQEMLQKILDTSPVGVAISINGVIKFVNPRYTSLVRARVGDPAARIYVNPADRERMIQALSQAEVAPDMEMKMYGPQGEVRDILATFMLSEYQGEPGILGWLVDITDLRRATGELAESRQRLDMALKGGNLGYWDADLRAKRTYTDEGWAHILGLEFDGLENPYRTWMEVIHPEDLEKVRRAGRDYNLGLTDHYEVEYRVRLSGGIEKWLAARGKAVDRDENGRVLRMVGIIMDITDRKRAEEAVKESEQRSRLILNSVGEGIFGVDAEGRMTFINPAALQMLGFSEDELMGRAVHPVIHHTRAEGCLYPVDECPVHASLTDGATHQVENEVLWRKNGSSFPVEYTSTPISGDGVLAGAVITFRDVSQRKQAEEEMRQYMEDLKRFNQLTLGREVRMIELKQEINTLLGQMGQDKKYKVQEDAAA